jgi:hypothetical protein
LAEWAPRDLPVRSCVICRSIGEWDSLDEFPRVTIWRLGSRAEAYTPLFREAVALGDVAIILDEGYEFAPAGSSWTGREELREIVLAGAHLARASDGDLRPTHLLVATQYPRTVNLLLWSQAYTVMVGVSSGDATFKWLRENFDAPKYSASEVVARLKPYQWECVRGERPALPGYGRD